LPGARRISALAGALLVGCIIASPAWGADVCGKPGYSYAGVVTPTPVHGIRAWVSAPLDPQVQSGDVSGWIGVGRTSARGKRGVLRVGLLASPGSPSQLYYEIRLRTGAWKRFLGPTVAAGERHKVSLLELAHRPTFWRVWIDGRALTRPIHLTLARQGKYALATAESWDGGTPTCNRLDYFFGTVAVRGLRWHPLGSRQVIQDPGYSVLRQTLGFAAKNSPVVPDSFSGDWETGDASQWTSNHWNRNAPLSDQFQIVTDPVRQGTYAAKFTVRPGDQFGSTSGERSEVVWANSNDGEGKEYWYRWSTLFPTDWSEPKNWGIFIQWHSFNYTPPAVALTAREDSAYLNLNAGPLSDPCCGGNTRRRWLVLPTLSKGLWNDFIAHIKWTSGNDGYITLWHRVEGQDTYAKVLDTSGFPTLQSDNGTVVPNYLVLGLYRDVDTITNTLYQDGFERWASADPPPEVVSGP
jgi:hypothetical protein